MPRTSRPRTWSALVKVVVSLFSLGLALVVTEAYFRLARPHESHHAAIEMEHFRLGGGTMTGMFTVDQEMGFRPNLGGAHPYSRWGTLRNPYDAEKPVGVERLLFVGDSVTSRGMIVEALRDVYGDTGFEYWNAGVESFNTTQELEFYKRYNRAIHPDHVILTFHLNDFQSTPVTFVNDAGDLVVYATHKPNRTINRDLFERFHLYRLWIGATTNRKRAWRETSQEVRLATQGFAEILRPDVELTVLVFPILSPLDSWSTAEKQAHREIKEILGDLQIRHVDLTPVVAEALDSGIAIRQRPDDPWHPNETFAELAAVQLWRGGLLDIQ